MSRPSDLHERVDQLLELAMTGFLAMLCLVPIVFYVLPEMAAGNLSLTRGLVIGAISIGALVLLVRTHLSDSQQSADED